MVLNYNKDTATKFNSLLYPLQKEIFNHPAKYKVWASGVRSGKSRLMMTKIGVAAHKFPGDYAILGPTRDQVRDVFWSKYLIPFCHQYKGLVNLQSKKWWNEGLLSVNCKDGSTIRLYTASDDGIDRVRGKYFKGIGIDEVAFLSHYTWDSVLQERLIDNPDSWALITSTPNGKNNLFHSLFEKGQRGKEGDPRFNQYMSWHSTSYANPHIDHKSLDAIKAEKGEDSIVWRREYMAEFCAVEGGVFTKFGEDNITTRAVYHPDWTTIVSIDPGYIRGITIVWQISGEGNVNIFDLYSNTNRGFNEARVGSPSQKEHLLKAIKDYKAMATTIDCAGSSHEISTGTSVVQMIRDAGVKNVIPIRKEPADFEVYIEQIRRLIRDSSGKPHLFIHPENCKYGVDAFYNISYPDEIGQNEHKYKKDGVYDHFVDAFRYGVKYAFPVNTSGTQYGRAILR